ncbi:hypothetical protein DFAR_2460001 [Desulfarculales bacterium]
MLAGGIAPSDPLCPAGSTRPVLFASRLGCPTISYPTGAYAPPFTPVSVPGPATPPNLALSPITYQPPIGDFRMAGLEAEHRVRSKQKTQDYWPLDANCGFQENGACIPFEEGHLIR